MRSSSSTPSPRTSPLWAPSTPIRAGRTNRPMRTSLCSTNSAGSISSSDIRTKKIRGPRGRTRDRGRPSESSRSDVRAVQDGAVGRLDPVGDPLDAERFEDLLAGPHAHRPAGVRVAGGLRPLEPRWGARRQDSCMCDGPRCLEDRRGGLPCDAGADEQRQERPYLTGQGCVDSTLVGKRAEKQKVSYTTYPDLSA